MLTERPAGIGLSEIQDPAAWLHRHDHDQELHDTIRLLIRRDGIERPHVAEAVLLLQHHIALTAPVRATLSGWGDEWESAVRELSEFRSYVQIRAIQKLLRATRQKGNTDA